MSACILACILHFGNLKPAAAAAAAAASTPCSTLYIVTAGLRRKLKEIDSAPRVLRESRVPFDISHKGHVYLLPFVEERDEGLSCSTLDPATATPPPPPDLNYKP